MHPLLSIEESPFGLMPDGSIIKQYVLTNSNGISIKLINYGATLISLKMPDKKQQLNEIILGFDKLEDYFHHEFYFGCTIGRVANRIANGKFNYAGKTYHLDCNNKSINHLHGGKKGFDKVVWQAKLIQTKEQIGVEFFYLSPDGEEHYPGNLAVKTTYLLNLHNELKIMFEAKTDQPTPVDLTNHTYWNLAGAGNNTVLQHKFEVNAESYIVTDSEHIPTGEIRPLAETAFDFRQSAELGKHIAEVPPGYDLCFVLNGKHGMLRYAAKISDPVSGRAVEVFTTQPGLQFYTGNYLYDYSIAENRRTQKYGAFCLETQNFPGAVHYPVFPSPFLLPEQTYHHETIYKLIY